LKWLINGDNQILEEKMYSHDTSKYGFQDQLVSIVNLGYKDFKARWTNISFERELFKLKSFKKLISKEIYHLYESKK